METRVRLTATIRDNLCDELLQQRFKKEEEELKQNLNELAIKIYKSVYPPKILDLMEQLPPKSFITSCGLRVRVGDDYFTFSLLQPLNFLYFHYQTAFLIDPESECGKEYWLWRSALAKRKTPRARAGYAVAGRADTLSPALSARAFRRPTEARGLGARIGT